MDTTCSLKLPPKSYRRTIEELSVAIPDPALKLEFLKQAIHEYQKISEPDTFDPAIAEIEFQNNLLHKAEEIWPDSKKAAAHIIQTDVQVAAGAKKSWLYQFRYAIGSAIVVFFVLCLSPALTPLVRSLYHGKLNNFDPKEPRKTISKIVIRKPITSTLQPRNGTSPDSTVIEPLNDHNWTDPDLKYFWNPTLIALTSQQIETHEPKNISQKSIGSLPQHSRRRKLNVTGFNSDKQEKEPALVLEHFESPVLITLAARPTKTIRPHHIFQELSPPVNTTDSEIGLDLTYDSIRSDVHHRGTDLALTRFQSPVLLSLSFQAQKNFRADHELQRTSRPSRPHISGRSIIVQNSIKSENIPETPDSVSTRFQSPILISLYSRLPKKYETADRVQKPILASQTNNGENQTAEANTKSVNQLAMSRRIQKFFQNPVLIALASHAATSFKTNRSIQDPGQLSKIEKAPASVELKPVKPARKPIQVPEYLNNPIWLVEKTSEREFYSNRLQIITSHTISNLPRQYYRFPKYSKISHVNGVISNKISGIVYHASESDVYPFMPEMNHSILKYSKQLIKFLKRKKSYHYFIDRFGRVYRLVREDHAAFHAGHSIWADKKEIYLNLNHAFIGICFEGKDFEKIKKQKKGQNKNSEYSVLKPTGISSFYEAQLRSGKELTDWLRVKYGIPQHNCVPHALISVNPRRMLIGYHLDLARGFPFAKFGLSDKYQEPLPSMVEFGFKYDKYFEKIFNGKLWRGIYLSEEILQRKAGYLEISFAAYRKHLQRRFTRFAEWKKINLEKKDKLALNPAKTADQQNNPGFERR